jgi:hypothetical protein
MLSQRFPLVQNPLVCLSRASTDQRKASCPFLLRIF